jgi:hypothetical protein
MPSLVCTLLPVGIGPPGIETTRRTPQMEKYYRDWKGGNSGPEQVGPAVFNEMDLNF